MNLAELKAAAKAVKDWNYFDGGDESDFDDFHALANPATILKLISVVETAQGVIRDRVQFCDGDFEELEAALKEMNDD